MFQSMKMADIEILSKIHPKSTSVSAIKSLVKTCDGNFYINSISSGQRTSVKEYMYWITGNTSFHERSRSDCKHRFAWIHGTDTWALLKPDEHRNFIIDNVYDENFKRIHDSKPYQYVMSPVIVYKTVHSESLYTLYLNKKVTITINDRVAEPEFKLPLPTRKCMIKTFIIVIAVYFLLIALAGAGYVGVILYVKPVLQGFMCNS
jgi:hypothetical protein